MTYMPHCGLAGIIALQTTLYYFLLPFPLPSPPRGPTLPLFASGADATSKAGMPSTPSNITSSASLRPGLP